MKTIAITCFLFASSIRPALAAPVDDLLQQALTLRRQGLHEQAFALFSQAYEKAPSPRTAAQMGLALQSLKRWVDSETKLLLALQSSHDAWIKKNRLPLEGALANISQHIGEIVVHGPTGAQVLIDGVEKEKKLPLDHPLRVGEGNVVVQVMASGSSPFATSVAVVGGERVVVDAQLDPIAAPRTSASPSVLPSPAHARPPYSPRLLTQPVSLTDDNVLPVADIDGPAFSPQKTLAAGLIVAGGISLVVGAIDLAVDGTQACDPPSGGHCARLRDTAAQGWIFLGLGAASAALGGVLLYEAKHDELSIAIGPQGLRASGRF